MLRGTIVCAIMALAWAAPAYAIAPRHAISATHAHPTKGIERAQLMGALKLDGKLFHVQGVAIDESHIWVTSVDKASHRGFLHQFDRQTGKFERRVELTDGPRYHPGGISISGHSIWVPVSEMKRNSSAVLDEVNVDTLQVGRRIPVADHLGCVAASDRMLVAGNWDSKLLYVFDLADGTAVHVVPNPSRTKFQDIKLIDGQLVGGGSLNRHGGSVDWIDWPSMKLVRSLRSGNTGRTKFLGRTKPYTAEGMTLDGRELYLVPQDGPSRMFHFHLET